jgi:hypothetical protein
MNLGIVSRAQGEMVDAGAHLEEALKLARELCDKSGIALCLHHLGEIAAERNDLDAARVMFEESMWIRVELGYRLGLVELLESYAGLALREGTAKRTVSLRAAADRIREEIASPMSNSERDNYAREMSCARQVLNGADYESACRAGRSMTLEQAMELALHEYDG